MILLVGGTHDGERYDLSHGPYLRVPKKIPIPIDILPSNSGDRATASYETEIYEDPQLKWADEKGNVTTLPVFAIEGMRAGDVLLRLVAGYKRKG